MKHNNLAVSLLLLVCCACSAGTDAITSPDQADPGDELSSSEVSFPDVIAETMPEDVGTELVFPAVDVADVVPDTNGCGMESGCFGDPCQGNDDCLSGLCLDHMGDQVCSDYCVEECPEDGWECKQVNLGSPDLVFACVSNHPRLCRPCAEDSECASLSGQEARCLSYAGEGSFCGSGCGSGKLCPEGFLCTDALAIDGTVVKQCVLETGVCDCSTAAIDLVLSTPCAVENEFGKCVGLRFCADTGLSQCDAATPSPEQCDGLDNNCDGETDEETCNDDNPCTKDGCVPGDGCIFQPLDGDSCDDGDSCTLGDVCSAGQCGGQPVECNDGNPCTEDLCDPVTGCKFQDASGGCTDGDNCTFGDFCEGGQCVAGVTLDCDDNNPCTDDACDPEAGCTHLYADVDCDDGNPCTEDDHCTQGLCVYGSLAACDDSNPCTDDWCDPVAGCQNAPNNAACNDNDLCTLGDSCSQGTCTGGDPLDCNDSNPCTSDSCNPLLGCMHTNNVQPCDDLDPCTQTDQCVGGQCVGTGAADCDDENPCTTDYCDPMAGCTHMVNASACDDGDLCTTADHCQGGNCIGGPALVCNDNNVCTDDSCAPDSGCQYKPNASLCDDYNDCTTDDYCSQGACISDQPLPCDDVNPCTKDICLPNGGCQFDPINIACSDGNQCTTGDWCQDGQCTGGPAADCDDGNPCTDDYCNQDSGCVHVANEDACSDGNECTLGDNCADGLCLPGTPLDCTDDNVCTTDFCDPKTGCGQNLNQAPCNDDNICTTNDQCDLGECKGSGQIACNDNNPCTDDSCAPQAGCEFVPNQENCDDGNECTTGDHCSGGFCTAGALKICNDQNPCTADYCDIALGCLSDAMDIPCDDGDQCTTGDWCVDAQCQPGAPAQCDDNNVCTLDSCDQDTGCVNVAQDGACSDGDACTEGDTCVDGLCLPGAPLVCDDTNVCTSDSCDEQTGCDFEPVDGPCDDGNECTTGDTCVDGSCQSSGTLICDDLDKCTQDSCDPDNGCLFDPILPCCGNSVVEPPEECDDGNENDGDSCKNNCTTGTIQAPECQNYSVLNESVRHVNFNDGNGGVEFCDSPPPGGGNKWYRFQGGAGVKMPTSCPSIYSCGTDAPGWMQGSYPSENDGQVNRTVCYNWSGSCCQWSNTIKVRNCGPYYVFYLPNTPNCHLSYCGSD